MVSLSDSQPPFDEIDVSPRCPYPFRRFLLKGVKNIDHLPETYGVESAIGVSVMDRDDLENPRALPFPWLRGGMFPAELSDPKRSAYLVFHGFGKYEKVSFEEPIQSSGLSPCRRGRAMILYPTIGISLQDARSA